MSSHRRTSTMTASTIMNAMRVQSTQKSGMIFTGPPPSGFLQQAQLNTRTD